MRPGLFRLLPGVTALLAVAVIAAVPASPPAAANEGAPPFVPGEVLVSFKPDVTPAGAAQVVRGLGAAVTQRFANPQLRLLRLPPGLATSAAIRALSGHPAVAHAQPNFIYHAIASPNDPRYTDGSLWGLHNTGQNSGTSDADIDAPEAWDLSTGSGDVVVAVIDTGVDYTHPDLAANIWTNTTEKNGTAGVDDDNNGYIDDIHGWDAHGNDGNPMDDNDHGTHCAGTIGGVGNNGAGVVGVNWNVKIVGCKFLSSSGSGSTADAIECLDYVHKLKDSGVNIVATNNSWGGGGYDQALKDAIERSNTRGILFVAAAGNGDFLGRAIDNDSSPQYPASYDNANIIAVTATDRNDKKASWANYGASSVDLGAPGVDIWSTVRGGYKSYSGTSMATPHVAGAAALLKAYNSTLSASEIKSRILDLGDPNAALEGKTVSGRRLNVYGALTGTVSEPAPPPSSSALSVTVTTDKSSYRFGDYVYITIAVTDDANAAVGGASVSLVITTANGKKYSGSSTTDSNGRVTFRYRPKKGDGAGTYKADATASKTGYTSGSGSTTFTVN